MSWTSPQDVVDRWAGPGTPTDYDLVQALIDDAESVILSEYPRIQERIDSGALALSTVVFVVSRQVSRVLRNPDNVSYWQQTTGPFGQARNFGEGNSDIWLLENEKSLLAPKKTGKAFNVDIAPNKRSPEYYPFEAPEVREIWREAGI